MVRAHSMPDMAHFITSASKAVFEHVTFGPQEALTGQQDGDLAASSAHSPPGLWSLSTTVTTALPRGFIQLLGLLQQGLAIHGL